MEIKNSEEDRKNKDFSKRICEGITFYLFSRYAKIYAPTANHGSENRSPLVPPSTRSNQSQQNARHGSKYASEGWKRKEVSQMYSTTHQALSDLLTYFYDFTQKQHSQVMISVKKGGKRKKVLKGNSKPESLFHTVYQIMQLSWTTFKPILGLEPLLIMKELQEIYTETKKDDRRNIVGFSRKQQNKRNIDSEGREAKDYGEASISR